MGKRNRRKSERSAISGPIPENGPAIVTRGHEIEEFAVGSIGSSRRYRNDGEHPLTLIYARGKLGCETLHHPRPKSGCSGCERYRAGDDYRVLYETRGGSGKDSTQPRIGGSIRPELSDTQQVAGLRVAEIERQMSRKNRLIIEAFCGKGVNARGSMVAAGIPFGPDSVLPRLCEALDELVEAARRTKPRRAA
jgi:hypothetical protein